MEKRYTGLKLFLVLLMALLIAGSAFLIRQSLALTDRAPETGKTAVTRPEEEAPAPTAAPTTEAPTTAPTVPEPEHPVATATVAAQGDLLMHKPIFDHNSVIKQPDGSHQFAPIFEHLAEYTREYDYSVINLETTFGGDGFPYQGNPTFNCPDSLMDAVVDAGYDMLLTANNHCSDTTLTGIKRTLEVVRGRSLATLGTQLSAEEPKYEIAEINGIRVGMVCYTYATGVTGEGYPRLNGLAPVQETGVVNWFMTDRLPDFYAEVEQILGAMEQEGCDATMLYIHWGVEYQTTEKQWQNEMAQALCDLGIDVIVGGHPHVVEPVELLTSTRDPEHHTVCIYSLGNAVSNQRTGVSELFPAGYTEDGALFTVTFEKYSDGTVYLADADVLPTWVNKFSNGGKWEYNILPLDKSREDTWQESFGLTDAAFAACQKSWDRTMGLVGQGLEQAKDHFAREKEARDAAYLAQTQAAAG